MSDLEKEAPGAGKRAGGAEDRDHHHPDAPSIAPETGGGDGEPLRPNPGAIRDALTTLNPTGPWAMSASGRWRGTVRANLAEAVEWAADANARDNVYVSIAALRPGWKGKKAKKEDVASVGWLWVDIDPRAGEDLGTERDRIRRLVTTELPKFRDGSPVPPPSLVIDSGRGFWALWRLAQPVEMPSAEDPGWAAAVAEVEARTYALEITFGADSCHNADRIMRLPGTVNRKPGAGMAEIASVNDLAYSLADFPPLAQAAKAERKAGKAHRIAAATGVEVAALPISDKLRALIVNGTDPDDPDRWQDRSRLVLYVLCELIRAGVSDAEMKTVITDPDLGISAHVLERKGSDAYADRQIARAHEQQPEPGPILPPLPMAMARAFRDAMRPDLRHHQQEFLDWDGAAYVGLADETVRAEVWRFLETCRVEIEKGGKIEVRPMVPKSEMVSGTIDALRAVSHLPPSRVEPPLWLDGRSDPNPMDLLSTRSGLLHLPTGNLLPATPEFFTRNALDFAHDLDAPPPERWIRFLREIWPGDDEADCIDALQDFMGYLLTPDTSLQKALLIPGPKRSGKGTIGHIMGKLVGEANTVAPTLNSFGRGDFALEPLLAKQLALVSDMRLSPRTDEASIAENLLRITGEDRVSVNRKYRRSVEVSLRTRFVILSNDLPKFADPSGALVSRFVVLPMRQSFYGREDPDLKRNLAAELPGILLWAVEGWRRVRATHRITQPEAGRDVALQMTDLSSPIPAFVREWCEIRGDLWVPKDRLFAAFREWHRERMGQDYTGKSNVFAQALYAATDRAVRDYSPRDGADRIRAFGGIALRPGFDARPRSDDLPF